MPVPRSFLTPWLAVLFLVPMVSLRAGSPSPVQIELIPDRDATLHSETSGTGSLNLANGAGDYFFAGKTGADHQTLRRALLYFDLSSAIPAGSTILSARLDLLVSKAPPDGVTQSFSLHRVTSDWGEGLSDPEGQEGQGASPRAGDATWEYGFFNSVAWTSPGGDFLDVASAQTAIPPSAGVGASFTDGDLARDVQHWVDGGGNFGWILIGNEGPISSARRFYSRNAGLGDGAPVLTITYQAVPEPSTGVLIASALALLRLLRPRGYGSRISTR
jgi:hypothetical protein